MKRNGILVALALATLFAFTATADAQRRGGRGYGGRAYTGGYYNHGYYNPGYYNHGHYGHGYGYYPGITIGIGSGYYPYGSYASTYGGYGYVPSTTYVDPGYPSVAGYPGDTSRESLYYSPDQEDNTARLRVLVPANAKVWVGGQETGQAGTEREFGSPALTPGKTYTYEVKARWMQGDRPVEKTRQVKVMANQTTTVDFGSGIE